MIHQETLESGLIRTWSDKYMLLQVETNRLYAEAIDVPNKYTYTESDQLKPDEELSEEQYQLRMLMEGKDYEEVQQD